MGIRPLCQKGKHAVLEVFPTSGLRVGPEAFVSARVRRRLADLGLVSPPSRKEGAPTRKTLERRAPGPCGTSGETTTPHVDDSSLALGEGRFVTRRRTPSETRARWEGRAQPIPSRRVPSANVILVFVPDPLIGSSTAGSSGAVLIRTLIVFGALRSIVTSFCGNGYSSRRTFCTCALGAHWDVFFFFYPDLIQNEMEQGGRKVLRLEGAEHCV